MRIISTAAGRRIIRITRIISATRLRIVIWKGGCWLFIGNALGKKFLGNKGGGLGSKWIGLKARRLKKL